MFTLTRESTLAPEELWRRLAALDEHADSVPLTTTIADAGAPGAGWRFTARTALGPLRFDDAMVVEQWEPPRRWRVRKQGFLKGWAEAEVTPSAGGSRLTWTEELWFDLPGVTRLTRRAGDVFGPLIFGPVVNRLARAQR